jgi:isopenicillin-N epimerase
LLHSVFVTLCSPSHNDYVRGVELDRWMLDPQVVHLNHGSFGGCLRTVFDEADRHRRALEASPMRWLVLEWQDAIDRARAALAAFVRAPADRLAFVPSATTGVAIALESAGLRPGDRVIVTSHGYRAVKNQLVRKRLALHVIDLPLPFDPDAFVDAIARAPDAKLAILDHITSPTALRLPLERVLPLLRCPVIVDGAHAPGQIDLDITALGATYYCGNNHKWLCAPKGSGFVVAKGPVTPVVTSHGMSPEYGPPNRLHAELDWSGTHDPSAHLAVPLAIASIDWPEAQRRNHTLVLEMRRRLCATLGAHVLAPDDAIGTMASIPITLPAPALVVENQLLRDGWEVPVIDFPSGPMVRVSAHLYNEADQADTLAAKLLALGVRGR